MHKIEGECTLVFDYGFKKWSKQSHSFDLFTPPEILMHSKSIDPLAADVYSCAIITWSLLSGSAPHLQIQTDDNKLNSNSFENGHCWQMLSERLVVEMQCRLPLDEISPAFKRVEATQMFINSVKTFFEGWVELDSFIDTIDTVDSCWQTDPVKRSDIASALVCLDNIIVDGLVYDTDGALFWKEQFLQQVSVSHRMQLMNNSL